MTNADEGLIQTGSWSEDVAWELYETTDLPPMELCTAVMCVAIADGKTVLTRNERGWGLLGGHIEDGESLEDALRREAREEGGFIIDQCGVFAVKKILSKVAIPHQRPGEHYPFPVSYMTYYWATTKEPLDVPTGEEIIECGSFSAAEIDLLGTSDRLILEAGWRAFTL
jgi:8-oxo-dGTP pyrophosphatase MutT (NUDIX family)